jgi:hypothetical protein
LTKKHHFKKELTLGHDLVETIENDHKAFKYDILVKNGPIRTEYVHVFDTVF